MPTRPLLVTADPHLLEAVLRLAGAARVELEVAADAGSARRPWPVAPLVLVGADVGPGPLRSVARRPGVVLLGTDLDDAGVWQRGVQLGAERVLFLPDDEGALSGLLADAGEPSGPGGLVLAVVGGRGGAGATTLATSLALAAVRRGCSALLLDADPVGGGIDLVLGGEDEPGLRWPDLARTRGRLPAAALASALPALSGVAVLSWDRGQVHEVPVEAMEAVLSAARRSHDVVVVDLPRQPDAAARAALAAAATTLLVVPAEVRAAAAASRVASSVGLLCPDLRVVVRGPSPRGLTGAELARALALPLAGEMRADRKVAVDLDRGDPPGQRAAGPLAVLCDAVLGDLLAGQEEARPGLRAA